MAVDNMKMHEVGALPGISFLCNSYETSMIWLTESNEIVAIYMYYDWSNTQNITFGNTRLHSLMTNEFRIMIMTFIIILLSITNSLDFSYPYKTSVNASLSSLSAPS